MGGESLARRWDSRGFALRDGRLGWRVGFSFPCTGKTGLTPTQNTPARRSEPAVIRLQRTIAYYCFLAASLFLLEFDFAMPIGGQGMLVKVGEKFQVEFRRTVLGVDGQHALEGGLCPGKIPGLKQLQRFGKGGVKRRVFCGLAGLPPTSSCIAHGLFKNP